MGVIPEDDRITTSTLMEWDRYYHPSLKEIGDRLRITVGQVQDLAARGDLSIDDIPPRVIHAVWCAKKAALDRPRLTKLGTPEADRTIRGWIEAAERAADD